MNEMCISGIVIGPGIAIGTPFFSACTRTKKKTEIALSAEEMQAEILRYRKALDFSRADLVALQKQLMEEQAFEAVKILDTHLQILSDPFLTTHIEEMAIAARKDIETVLRLAMKRYEDKLSDVQDPLFKQRLVDIVDIAERIYSHLQGSSVEKESAPFQAIIFANELTPSQVASMRFPDVTGLVTQQGGGHSHAALIAKAKGIPYLSSIDMGTLTPEAIHTVILDGTLGHLIINPSETTLATYKNRQCDSPQHVVTYNQEMQDVHCYANIGSLEEVENAIKLGAEGIGLFRSEQLLLEKSQAVLSEDAQYNVYSLLMQKMEGKPCTIRAFDIGGDKRPAAFTMHRARGMRFLLQEKTLFLAQLRAIARLSYPVSLLLPWVADVDELLFAKQLVIQACREVKRKSLFPIGCMVELPSLVCALDAIVKHVDFLSLGTNDLMQQTLGIEREDPIAWHSIGYLLHPSLIHMIHLVVKATSLHNIPLTLCGEIGSLPQAIPLLLGLGVRCFSCTPSAIAFVKQAIHTHPLASCQSLAEKALQLHSPQDIEALIKQKI